eukprot:1141286-Prymnesium_polylepis.1
MLPMVPSSEREVEMAEAAMQEAKQKAAKRQALEADLGYLMERSRHMARYDSPCEPSLQALVDIFEMLGEESPSLQERLARKIQASRIEISELVKLAQLAKKVSEMQDDHLRHSPGRLFQDVL